MTNSQDFKKNKRENEALALFEKAIRRPKAERETFVREAASNDSDLILRTLALLKLDQGSSANMLTGHAVFGENELDLSGNEIGDYRIVNLIGKGGMGAVYRAERLEGDFTHNVAIKVIRRGAASDALIERFLRERQILADLSHPHIASLLGGGKLPDETPYFIMELIDGAPITEWIESENLNLDTRLILFLQACDAVKHAHQNLIVHRDITPNNVLVTAQGSIKFIDFGIAKPINKPADGEFGTYTTSASDLSNSLDGLTLTPGFAAPERSKGATPNTLSDIFSLGKLLDVITNKKTRPKDIQSIINKAAQSEPHDRYSSVDSLIDDLKAYQLNFPVKAHKGGVFYDVGKFIKRQKLSVALSVLALAALTLGYIGFERAKTANVFADARFSETRDMTTFLLEDLPSSLRSIPGTLPVQKEVTEVSAKYLDILAKAAKDDPAVLFDYAMGHAQLGDILTVAGGANIGDPKAGLGHYKESLKTLKSLEATNPNNSDLQVALADTEYGYAYAMMYHMGAIETGNKFLNDSLRRYRTLTKIIDTPNLKINYLSAQLLELFYGEDRNFFEEVDAAKDLRAQYESLIADNPNHDKSLRHYASLLRNMAHGPYKNFADGPGTLISNEERLAFEQGLRDVNLSLELIDKLLKREPNNTSHIYQFVWSAEILILMNLVDKAWETKFEDIIGDLARAEKPFTRQNLRQHLQSYDPISKDKALMARLFSILERSDKMLAQIAPYEAETFTHVEATYYNVKLHSYLQGRFNLDLEQAHAYNAKAKAMIDAFKSINPDFRNAYLEDAVTHNEKAFIYGIEQAIFKDNNYAVICDHVNYATALWKSSEERWGKIEDYLGDIGFTNTLLEDWKCPNE